MKNTIKKIQDYIHWYIVGKPLSSYDKANLKMVFRAYFEGYFPNDKPECPMLINAFGITKLRFRERKQFIEIEVTLEYPNRLIGYGGKIIDGLCAYLTSRFGKTIKIHIVESKIWSNI